MIPDLVTRYDEPVLLVRTSLFDPEHKDLDIGEQSKLSAEQAGQAMAVANIFREGCTATTAAVQLGNSKCLEEGDEISVRPVDPKAQVSIFMQQQSGSPPFCFT